MEKLSMGEYGAVVWAAYGTAFIVLAAVTWASLRGFKYARKSLKDAGA